jgi:hypothetical protein
MSQLWHSGVAVVLQWCYNVEYWYNLGRSKPVLHLVENHSEVIVVLQKLAVRSAILWCYNGDTVVLQIQWCYSGVAVMQEWCHSYINLVGRRAFRVNTVVLQRPYSDMTVVSKLNRPGMQEGVQGMLWCYSDTTVCIDLV